MNIPQTADRGLVACLNTDRGSIAKIRYQTCPNHNAFRAQISDAPSASSGIWSIGPSVAVVDHDKYLLVVDGQVRTANRPAWIGAADRPALVEIAERLHRDGADALTSLRGTFVLFFINRESGDALAAIDRIGVRSLCHSQTPGGSLVIANDATLLRQHPAVSTELDTQQIFNYLYFHMVPSPNTVFKRIGKLGPAQYIACTGEGAISVSTYWRPDFQRKLRGNARDAQGELLQALTAAVDRSRSEAATGTFLSGGIDSSTVTGLATRRYSPTTRAYSMGFAAAGYDEAHFAQTAARHFGCELRQFYVEPDHVADELENVAREYDEPFGNSSAVPTLLCAKFARAEGIDVLLAGDGGDELFAGNTRYAKQRIFDIYHRIPGGLRRGVLEKLFTAQRAEHSPWPLRKLASYVQQARMPMPERTESYNFLNRQSHGAMFEAGFAATINTRQPFDLLQTRYDDISVDSLVDRMLYLDWKFTLADNDLRKVGRMCSLAGVAVRFPWLDDDVIELSTRIPGDVKMPGTKLRHFVKSSLNGFLPDEIINKSKHGFGLPFGEWLKTSKRLQELTYELLLRFRQQGIVRPDFVDMLIAEHRSGHAAYYGTMVWVMAMLQAWLDAHRLARN